MKKQGNFMKTLNNYRNDGTDPRKNDIWRILLFAANHASGASIMIIIYKWGYFTQNVLQLGVMFATIILPAMVLDAITDPIIANIFDRFDSKWGKFRPFMITGALLSVLPALCVFFYPVNPDNIPIWASFAILSACYALIVVGNTVLMTATRAGQAIITQDPKQRPLYAIGHTVADAIVSGFVTITVTSGIFGKMQDPKVWKIAIVALSTASIVFVLIAMKAIETRDNPRYYGDSKSKESASITEFFKLIKRSKPIKCLLIASASDAIAATMRATMMIYLFANIIMNRSLNATFELLNGVVLGVPVLLIGMYFATKKGSAEVYKNISLVQTIISTLGFVITLIVLPLDANYEYKSFTFSVLLVLAIFGTYISTLGISTNLINAMTGDLTDYEYIKTGKFIPGTIGATLTFANKLANSLVGILATAIMAFCGFAGEGASSVVPENVYVNDRFYYCVLLCVFICPALGHLATVISMRKYPINGDVMKEVSIELAQRRGFIEKQEVE